MRIKNHPIKSQLLYSLRGSFSILFIDRFFLIRLQAVKAFVTVINSDSLITYKVAKN